MWHLQSQQIRTSTLFTCNDVRPSKVKSVQGRTERMRVNPVRSSSGLRASSSTFSSVVNSRILNSTLASPICSTWRQPT